MTDHDNLTATIVDAFNASSDTDKTAGRAWYPHAGAVIASLAEWSDTPDQIVAAVVAALSPRNPWAWNVQDAAAVLHAAQHGLPCPTVTTFNTNRDRAWAFATGASGWRGSALKVRSFVANMAGDVNAVTVDVWAVRVATAGARSEVKGDADYQTIADAYRAAATAVNESPRDLQAIVWIAAQTAGLGSRRRGRGNHATAKRGTLSIVAALLGLPFQLGLWS